MWVNHQGCLVLSQFVWFELNGHFVDDSFCQGKRGREQEWGEWMTKDEGLRESLGY